jgi:fibronectin-binding autotransporter adhesin
MWLLSSAISLTYADGPHHVALDCTGVPAPCHTSLQAAVDAAVTGDAILVATGIYTDIHVRSRPPGYVGSPAMTTITQVVMVDKALTIRGGYTLAFTEPPDPQANPTTLDAEGKGRVLVVAGYISPTIEGLRLTGGTAAGQHGESSGNDAGGGVYVISATATLSNNQIFSNTAYSGGGLYLRYSDAILDGNVIVANAGGSGGGGGLKMIYSDDAVLRNNFVATNTAPSAGGLFVNVSDATLSGNIVVSNTATTGVAGGVLVQYSNAVISANTVFSNTAAANGGGGLYLLGGNPILTGNTILSNTGEDGGGIALYQSDATFLGNTIAGNHATGVGGGLSLYYSDATLEGNVILTNTANGGGGLFIRRSSPTLTNTVVANNRTTGSGGGLSITDGSSPRLLHTTITGNTAGSAGSGMHVYLFATYTCTVSMTNTILANHWMGIYVASGNVAQLASTLWYSNTADWSGPGQIITGTLNYWGDPRFATDGYHLLSGSVAIDRGVNAGVTSDIDGDTRPQGGGYDLGADEFVWSNWHYLYLPLVLRQ